MTWKLEDGEFTYEKEVLISGARVFRARNWIRVGTLVFPCTNEVAAKQLEAELRNLAGSPRATGFSNRIGGKAFVGYLLLFALYVALAVKFLSV